MKSFAIAAALLPLLTLAMPMNDGGKGEHHEPEKHHDWKEDSHSWGAISNGPFDFTSTYTAWATPDQV